MFVPKAVGPGARNPRRRQRTGSDDSAKPPKAKRQRSVLRQVDDSASDANLDRENGGEVARLTISTSPNSYDDVIVDQMGAESHLPIRGNKQSEGLQNDMAGTVVLVSGPLLLGVTLPRWLRGPSIC